MNLAGLLDVLKIWVQERGRGSHESGRPPERLKDLGTREGPRIS